MTEAARLPQHTGPEEADQPPSMSSHAGAPAPPSRNPCCLCWCCCCSCSWYVGVGVGRGGLSRPGPETPLPNPHVASEASPAGGTPLPPTARTRGCWVLVAGSQCPVRPCLLLSTRLLTPLTAWPADPQAVRWRGLSRDLAWRRWGQTSRAAAGAGLGLRVVPGAWSASGEAV